MKTKMKFLILGYLALALISCSSDDVSPIEPEPETEPTSRDKKETFTFSSNGTRIGGKIFIPSEYENNKNLPAIYLIDFTEQHFKVAMDEFDKVIYGAQGVKGLNPLVITLEKHMDIDYQIEKGGFQKKKKK